MRILQNRLRNLERVATDKAPMLVYVPDNVPTPEQQREIDLAKQAGRAVILVTATDADL